MKNGIIYIAISKTTGEGYIGQTTDILKQRQYEHKMSSSYGKDKNSKFYNAIREYGYDDFGWAILIEAPESELNNLEVFMIRRFNTYHKGYNSTVGGLVGNRGYKHTEETKKKMHRPRSDETKKRISDSKRGRSNANKGKHHSDETKKKLSEINTGKVLSAETRAKMSKSRIGIQSWMLGTKQSQETINKKTNSTAKTYRITKPDGTIEVIKNLAKYCREHGLSATSMGRVAKGRYKHHKGYCCELISK